MPNSIIWTQHPKQSAKQQSNQWLFDIIFYSLVKTKNKNKNNFILHRI